MPTKEEIQKVMQWCEDKKKERGRIYAIERNAFREEIRWTYRFPFIEIDRPKEVAAKTNLVYDSLTKSLWQYMNNDWRRISEDARIQ
ncbi:MAG: hypothetical protein Q7S22_01690 [Candidatus Micrarchaeota archaeon]|nr:hypothetical protein [Candidatus Micrarchaeota archaeon]